MIALYNNLATQADISSFSENPNFTFSSAFNDTVLAHAGRTIADSGEWIKFSFTSAVSVSSLFIFNHNFEAGATVILQGNATDSWGAPSVSRTQTISDVIYESFPTETYQYWRIYMHHPSSTDGYFKVGKIFFGVPYTTPDPTANIDMPENAEPRIYKSTGGQMYGQSSTFLQMYSFNLEHITKAEKIAYKTFADTVNYNIPFAFSIYENSTDAEPPIYANLVSRGGKAFPDSQGEIWNIPGVVVEECK